MVVATIKYASSIKYLNRACEKSKRVWQMVALQRLYGDVLRLGWVQDVALERYKTDTLFSDAL
jgi:hypothetical protein